MRTYWQSKRNRLIIVFRQNYIKMKYVLPFALLCATLFLTACQSDDDATPFSDGYFHYDGSNNTAPNLDPGEHEAATRFTANMLADFKGQHIKEIEYFMAFPPAATQIKIYSSNGGNVPTNLLYTANVSNGITETSWNTHTVTRDIIIGEEDIWVSVALSHDIRMQSIGCDSGPANSDGNWLFQSVDGEWKTYQARTNESINWNIRMQLEE